MLKWAIARDYHKRWNNHYTTDEYIRFTLGGKRYKRRVPGIAIYLFGVLVMVSPFLWYVVKGGG
jgi:hypothetical protein